MTVTMVEMPAVVSGSSGCKLRCGLAGAQLSSLCNKYEGYVGNNVVLCLYLNLYLYLYLCLYLYLYLYFHCICSRAVFTGFQRSKLNAPLV